MGLVLASGSPRRAKILRSLGIDFTIAKTGAPEKDFPGDPERTVRENALAKGAACTASGRILSADTIVWFGGRIYGKPRDLDEARRFLRELSGKTHSVYTAVALDGEAKTARSDVTFRALGEAEIDAYVEAVRPLDRAGAYDIDESGGAIVAGWTGGYENIMGLPVGPLVEWGLVPNAEPVGFFDSGDGGRAVLDAFAALCPNESTVYLADRRHFPYGGRRPDEVAAFSLENARRLVEDEGCKAVVVACNTATSAAIERLRAQYPGVPFVGVEPAVKPAAAASKTGKIAVLATAGTIAGRKYAETVARHAHGVKVVGVAAPELVALAERGETSGEAAERAVRAAVEPLVAAGCDAIVLGCTHFTRLAPLVEAAAAGRARVFDGAQAVARRTRDVLAAKGLAAPAAFPPDSAVRRFLV